VSSIFEKALRSRCEADPDVAPLGAQWEFDQRLIANALAGVALTFPHYSRHDASHSNTILLQLARVMGEARIARLPATDLWLLLEAAYHHDLGMVLTDEEARQFWISPDFDAFAEQMVTGSDPDLRRAAELTRGQITRAPTATWPLDVRRAVVLLLAEFVRRQHAARAQTIIRTPGMIGLESPRTGLLPARLFGVLEDICRSHGQSFESTMQLPKAASGMGTDVAHPRFVACMLRIGDLLDLDNGRFCPVLQRVGGAVPASSLAHVEKHAAIKHLLVSPELIEVEAECETYPAYEVTWQWLDWLRQEVQGQMLRWNDIAPEGFGALPSLGKIETRQKSYLALQPGQRPRFEVDQEAVLKLLQGANVYKDREEAIRELIQNSIDATLLRLWSEHWSRLSKKEIDAKTPNDLRRALAAYPIDMTFERLADGSEWRVSILDRGTGIAFTDLRYLLTVGSSRRNPDRRRAIHQMPEWMRPSGTFGIGLQSVFLLTQEVVILTKHHDTAEAHEITLRANEAAESSGLQLRKLSGEERAMLPTGTRITFTIKTGHLTEDLHWHITSTLGDRKFPTTDKLVREFDPIVSKELPYFVTRVRELVHQLAQHSLCPILIDQQPLTSPETLTLYFDPESTCEYEFWFDHNQTSFSKTFDRFLYRGAPVRYRFDESLVHITCNIHVSRADQYLSLNREYLTHFGASDITKRVRAALQRMLPAEFRKLRDSDPAQARVASLLGHLWQVPETGDDWRALELPHVSNGTWMSLQKILESPSVIFLQATDEGLGWHRKGKDLTVRGDPAWMRRLLERHFASVTYDGAQALFLNAYYSPATRYIYSQKAELGGITDRGLIHAIVGKFMLSVFRRVTIPCQHQFYRLQVTDTNILGFEHRINELGPRMVSPFVVEAESSPMQVSIPHLSALVGWTCAHTPLPRPAKREVANSYLKFIRKVDRLLRQKYNSTALKRNYDLRQIEHELGAIARSSK